MTSPSKPKPKLTAAELVAKVTEAGGRIYRMRQPPFVFVITDKEKLAERLVALGGHPFRPTYLSTFGLGMHGGYKRSRDGVWNWDIYIHTIPVKGEETIWEAVGGERLDLHEVRRVTAEASK